MILGSSLHSPTLLTIDNFATAGSGIFGAETTCTAPLDDAEANTCMAESCSIEHQLLCSGASQQCVHRTPERTSSVALEDVMAGNNLLTMICKDSDQVCHPGRVFEPQACHRQCSIQWVDLIFDAVCAWSISKYKGKLCLKGRSKWPWTPTLLVHMAKCSITNCKCENCTLISALPWTISTMALSHFCRVG